MGAHFPRIELTSPPAKPVVWGLARLGGGEKGANANAARNCPAIHNSIWRAKGAIDRFGHDGHFLEETKANIGLQVMKFRDVVLAQK